MQSLIPTLANYCWLQEMPVYEEDLKGRCKCGLSSYCVGKSVEWRKLKLGRKSQM